MKIIAIKTNEGYLISDNIENKSYFTSHIKDLFFDSVKADTTFKSDWFKIKSKPVKIERLIYGTTNYVGFKLKDESLSDRFKETYWNDEVFDEDVEYLDFFRDISSLYERIVKKTEDKFEQVEFEWDEILEIEIFKEPDGFNYKAAGQWERETYPSITEKNLKYDILAQVITPSILLHTQPCKLSSKETYDIIRKYIKENINPRVAEITSDYDFCFTVKKKIPLAKPYSYQIDVNNSIFDKRKRKPSYETRLVDKKSIQVFEMTHNQTNGNKGYDKYTLITPFEAENQEALKEYIDKYLEELITAINEPVCECEWCNGTGVLFSKIIK